MSSLLGCPSPGSRQAFPVATDCVVSFALWRTPPWHRNTPCLIVIKLPRAQFLGLCHKTAVIHYEIISTHTTQTMIRLSTPLRNFHHAVTLIPLGTRLSSSSFPLPSNAPGCSLVDIAELLSSSLFLTNRFYLFLLLRAPCLCFACFPSKGVSLTLLTRLTL
jgi:hypothetical protein